MMHDVKKNQLLKGTVGVLKRGASHEMCHPCERVGVFWCLLWTASSHDPVSVTASSSETEGGGLP